MARKVFISVLGANIYSECTYGHDGIALPSTRFIQEATLRMHQANKWPDNSTAYILLTDEACVNNWEVEGDKRTNWKGETIDYRGLRKRIADLHLPFKVEGIPIPKGETEEEIWKIFETTFNLFEDGDELYFDLTHGFRYLPMLVLVLGNYAKFLKNADVKAITYGNWEGRDRTTNIAPIVNLLPLSSLQDWTFATANFKENGYSQRLFQLSRSQISAAFKAQKSPDSKDITLGNSLASLSTIVNERLMCRGMNIVDSTSVRKADEKFHSIEDDIKPQFFPLIKEMRKSLEHFDTSRNVHNLFAAANWCMERHLYQQATTFLEEGVISFFCQRHEIPLHDRDRRELITSAFNIKDKNIPKEQQQVKNERLRPLLNEILEDPLLAMKKLVKNVTQLIDLRNDYNHCGFRRGALPDNKIIANTARLITQITNWLKDEGITSVEGGFEKPPLFINLSNHPSAFWGERQREEAARYGEIIDMDFPKTDPEATKEEIDGKAYQLSEEIAAMAINNDVTVHVMGEMTFTYRLVERLKAEGITCVASTTERQAEEHDGVKTSVFNFVQFREY